MGAEARESSSKEPSKFLQGVKIVAGVVGGAAGYAFGAQAFAYIIFPGVFALIAGALLYRLVPKAHAPILGACAIQIGHGLWMLLGMVIIISFKIEGPIKLDPFDLIDVVLLVGVSIWLAYQPGWIPCGILALYQIFGITINSMALAEQPAGGPMVKALLVHLFLRIAALVAMGIGLYEVRRTLPNALDDVEEIDEEEDEDDGEASDAIDDNPYHSRKG